MVLTDTTGPNQDIATTHSGGISADIFLDAVVIYVQGHDRTRISGSYGSLDLTHIGRDTGKTGNTTSLIDQVGKAGTIHAFLIHDERQSTRIHVAATSTHQQTLNRSQAHGSIHALTILDGGNRTTVTYVSRDNLLILIRNT